MIWLVILKTIILLFIHDPQTYNSDCILKFHFETMFLQGSYMEPSWLSVLPPLIVLFAACVTKKLYFSLIIGIVCASFIAASGHPYLSLKLVNIRLFQYLGDKDSLYMFSFLIIIGAIIILICKTGGISAFAHHMKKRFSSKRAAESSSLILSILVGIDDYLNSITVGHVMRSIADKFGIARAKLAFLLHAMSGPLVILIPISSWAAVITSNLDSSGISLIIDNNTKIIADPFFVYLKTMPFIFYSVFTIFSVWYIVHRQLSFGPMRRYEEDARERLSTTTQNDHKSSDRDYSLLDIIIPLATLLGTVLIGILYTGGYWLLGGNYGLIMAFKNNTQNSLILFIASLITLVVTFLLSTARKKITLTSFPKIIKEGFFLMAPAIVMLILANTLGNILRFDLLTGKYLADTFLGSLSITFVPAMFFFIAAITALLTGTSWGTMALILPIAIPMITSMAEQPLPIALINLPILFPSLGAIFSGAVCGDQLSPLSETTIMVASSAGTTPFTHFLTQFPYAIPAFIASVISFILSGSLISNPLWLDLSITLFCGLTACILILHIMQRFLISTRAD